MPASKPNSSTNNFARSCHRPLLVAFPRLRSCRRCGSQGDLRRGAVRKACTFSTAAAGEWPVEPDPFDLLPAFPSQPDRHSSPAAAARHQVRTPSVLSVAVEAVRLSWPNGLNVLDVRHFKALVVQVLDQHVGGIGMFAGVPLGLGIEREPRSDRVLGPVFRHADTLGHDLV